MSIITFLIILFLLVLVHEFGHFIVAKKSGIRVDEFAIGFPPRLWGKKIGVTLYSLNVLPIGGFVKIYGENPEQDSIDGPDSKRSLVNAKRHIQALVLVAGVTMNVLFAWFLFTVAIVMGLPAPAGYAGDKELVNGRVAILSVLPNTPAEIAGIKAGEKIISISNDGDVFSSSKVEDVQGYISKSGGKNLVLTLEGAGKQREVAIVPQVGLIEGRAGLGVSLGQVGTLKLPVHQAVYEAGKITVYLFGAITIGLFDLIKTALMGNADLATIAGPVGIVGMVGEASNIGFAYLLGFAAMISVNLAVLNLLPFPALDGGRLLFVAIEAIIRRPIKPVIANTANLVGFAILILLMIVVTYSDIMKLI